MDTIDPSINGLFWEPTSGFLQTDQPHVKLILSSHGTCHTAQYEPALPSQNNINQMNLSHQKLFLYSCTYGAAKGKHMVGFGSLMVSRSVLPPLTLFLDLSHHFLSLSHLVLDFFCYSLFFFMCNPDFLGGLANREGCENVCSESRILTDVMVGSWADTCWHSSGLSLRQVSPNVVV